MRQHKAAGAGWGAPTACMLLAMEEVGIEEDVRERLLQNFFNTADFLRNKAD